ncbi:hypothetical protein [Pseudomonas proteolytica]|uniref:hypothetical protein n=1 Tax=Pseudomonas proteolytica TaxID=219574 RepID=UPI00147332FF|nr:hypothetical protein [Pseudomonas proteolytica]NMZ34003.1 hypothetical protein [Pseudomonas proteolytica]
MELTQPQGGEIVGSLRSLELSSTGEISTLMANVKGAVDGERLTLAISTPRSSTELTYSGVISDKGLELNLSGSTGLVSKVNFARDSVENFNVEANRLAQAGEVIKTEKLKVARVVVLNRSASVLEASLDAYVKRAKKQISDTPRFVSYFAQASKEIGAKFQLAQRLAAGNDRQRLQAENLFVQVEGSEPGIRNTSESIDGAIEEMVLKASTLKAQMTAFKGICIDDASSLRPGDVIPDMGPCKGLIAAASSFEAVQGPVNEAHERLQKMKAAAIAQLEPAWRTAGSPSEN